MRYLLAILTTSAAFALDYDPDILLQEWGTATARITTRKVDGNVIITQWDNCTIPDPPTDEQIAAILYKAEARTMRQQVVTSTTELLTAGFAHDGHTFALTAENRADWTALVSELKAGTVALPQKVSTADDDEYELTSVPQARTWYLAGLDAANTIRSRDRRLRKALKQATSQADLDTIKASADWLAHIGG